MFLVEKLEQFTDSHVRTIAWAFSNMCRHKNPNAPLDVLRVLAQGLVKLVQVIIYFYQRRKLGDPRTQLMNLYSIK